MTSILRSARWLLAAVLPLSLAACSLGPTPTPTPACPTTAPSADEAQAILADADRAVVVTNKGEFTIELDSSSAPVAVGNFVALARCGYYDQVSFHRVAPGFVAQAGDPQTRENRGDFDGLGSGGPGYRFEVEFPPEGTTYAKYMVAMANAIQYDRDTGEITSPTDSNGGQFFVMLNDAPALRPYYSVMGRVTVGTDVVDAIGQVPTTAAPMNVPLDPVVIETISIESGPAESPA
jgi:cyclophilin family peptidyl-prolyl cis-trans isomerase